MSKKQTREKENTQTKQVKKEIEKDFSDFENELKLLAGVKAGIIYFLDNKHCIYLTLNKIAPVLRIKKTSEVFKLDKPSFYIHGKPIFILKRGIPFSIEMEFNNKNRKLIEKGYTSSEIDAKIHSTYTNMIFRRKVISIENITLLILTNVISILISYIVF